MHLHRLLNASSVDVPQRSRHILSSRYDGRRCRHALHHFEFIFGLCPVGLDGLRVYAGCWVDEINRVQAYQQPSPVRRTRHRGSDRREFL
jgi:hypothetical protein